MRKSGGVIKNDFVYIKSIQLVCFRNVFLCPFSFTAFLCLLDLNPFNYTPLYEGGKGKILFSVLEKHKTG